MTKRLIFLMLFIIPVKLLAQGSVNGTIYDFDRKTFPLQKVRVKNLTNHQVAVTKASGQFSIPAQKGDILELSLMGYHTDTVYLVNLNPQVVYLPSNSTNLKEVAIVSTKISPYLDLTNPEAKESKRIMTDGLSGKKNNDRAGGLILALGYGKYKKAQEKAKAIEDRELYETEIKENFNEQTVNKLVKLRGHELKDFVRMYMPSAELVKAERPFNYTYYIARAYQAWLKLSPGQRNPPPSPGLKAN